MIADSHQSTGAVDLARAPFWQRRWDPHHPSGRHLTLCMIAGGIGLLIFVVLAVLLTASSQFTPIDQGVDGWLRHGSWNTDSGRRLFTNVSEIGGTVVIVWMGVLATVVLLLSGHPRLALVILIAAVGGAFLDRGLKDLFHLARPPLELPPGVKAKAGVEPSWGFPSGHSLGSIVGYGLLAYLLVTFILRQRVAQLAMILFLGVTVLLIGFSRLYLHAHYLSQVLAGFSIGGFWLSGAVGALEVLRRHAKERETASGPPKRVAVDTPPSSTPGGWQAANR